MSHDAFKAERRAGAKTREDGGEVGEAGALAAHAGIDLKVDGQRIWLRSGSASSGLKRVELPGFPRDRRQLELDGSRGLAGKDATHYEDARLGTQRARDDAFFNTGDTEPVRSGADDRRSAECEGVAVSIGFDDGEKIGMWSGEAEEKTEVFLEGASANLDPAGTH
jgi:hypothetical protein